jgi:hypothetical protein
MGSDQLFEMAEGDRPEPEPKLSTDRRRTLRQKQALTAGKHPTSLYFGRIVRLHTDAAPAEDRKAEGLRCGDCALLSKNGWWPACVNHEAAS